MFKIKLLLTPIILILLLNSCSENNTTNPNIQQDTVGPEEYIIFDNDFGFSDPDNDGSLAYAIALHNQGLIKLLAVSRVGYDLQNNGTLITSAQLYHGGLQHIPIGINPNSSAMRQVVTIGSTHTPAQNSSYTGNFKDIREFPNDGCVNNNIGCGTRVNMIEMYKNALENSPKKVTIASGGQVINIAEALQAYPALFAEKVKKITFLGRSTSDFLTGQDFGGNTYAIWAMKYLVDNLPDNIELVDCSTDRSYSSSYQNIPNSRIGDIWRTHDINSPIAFVYGLEHPYGVGLVDGYSIIDGIPLLHAAFGNTLPNGQVIGHSEGVSFSTTSGGANINKSANGKHFLFQANTSEWGTMKDYLQEVLLK